MRVPLGFADGRALDVPDGARFWLVRSVPPRKHARGRAPKPRLIRAPDADGLPLLLHVRATTDDLIDAVDELPGLYQLDARDHRMRSLGCSLMVELTPLDDNAAEEDARR